MLHIYKHTAICALKKKNKKLSVTELTVFSRHNYGVITEQCRKLVLGVCSRRGSSEAKTTVQSVSQRQFTHVKPDVRQRVGHTSRAVSDDCSSSSVTGTSMCCRLDFRLALRTRSQARLSSCFTCSMAAQSAVSSKSTRGGTTEGPHEVCIRRPHLSQWEDQTEVCDWCTDITVIQCLWTDEDDEDQSPRICD